MTDIRVELIITERKFLKICMDVRAGKIIRLDISMAPIILIPKTMVTAVKSAKRLL